MHNFTYSSWENKTSWYHTLSSELQWNSIIQQYSVPLHSDPPNHGTNHSKTYQDSTKARTTNCSISTHKRSRAASSQKNKCFLPLTPNRRRSSCDTSPFVASTTPSTIIHRTLNCVHTNPAPDSTILSAAVFCFHYIWFCWKWMPFHAVHAYCKDP